MSNNKSYFSKRLVLKNNRNEYEIYRLSTSGELIEKYQYGKSLIFQTFDEKYGVQTEYNKDLYSQN